VGNPLDRDIFDTLSETKTIEADLLQAEEQLKAKEEHFKTPIAAGAKFQKRIVAFYFLKDCGRYCKEEVVGVEIQGEFSVLPGISRRLECREAHQGQMDPLC
jgi:hypothetical protein